MTPSLLLRHILGAKVLPTDIAADLPNQVYIELLSVDICDEKLSVAVASNQTYSIIDGILSVEGFKGKLYFFIPTRAIEFSIQTSWRIGNLDFRIDAIKKDSKVIIEGRPILSSNGSSISEVSEQQ